MFGGVLGIAIVGSIGTAVYRSAMSGAPEAARQGVRNGFPCLAAVENEPLFATLRSEPDYQALLAELRASRDHYRMAFEDLREIVSAY